MKPWLLSLLVYVAVVAGTDNVTQLVVRLRKTISVVRVNQDSRRVTGSESIVSGIDDVLPVNLDVHFRRNAFVYIEDWTKPKYDNVRMVTLSSQQQTTPDRPAEGYKTQKVRSVDTTITSVAVDWVTDKVYMSLEMESSARIDVCDMAEDGLCAVLLYYGLDNLHSLVVDPIDGYMYWLNQILHRIERAWMDGRHHETNPFREDVDENRLVTATALAIDHAFRRLYYVRSASGEDKSEIWRCDLHNRDSCMQIVQDVNAFYLDVLRNVLFWAPTNGRGIFTCDMKNNNCSATTLLIAKSDGIEALRVFDAASQPLRKSPNPCASDNGDCSHLCLLIAGEPWRSCACPTGVRLREDGRTCAPNGVENALFLAAASGPYYISLDTDDFTPIPVAYKGYNSNEAHKVIAVDYDPVDRFVYWVDGDLGKIRRSRINGSDLIDVITEEVSEKAEALVVDWLGRNLFWLDAVYCRIEVARLDGSSRRTIISTDLSHPRGLAIDPYEGYLYFSDWYQKNPRIERAYLDGSHRQVLVSFPKDSWPNGLVVDRLAQRLYYTEARTNVIGYVNLFNSRDTTVLTDLIHHPYGLSIHGPWLYYSSWVVRVVGRLRLDQHNESRSEVLADSVVAGQMGIRAINLLNPPPGTNLCSGNNGGCSHICLHLPHMQRRCLCPVGYELKMDNATCILPEAFLMFTQSGVKDISRISLHRYPSNLDRLNMQHVDSPPQVIDLDQQTQRVYWSSAKERAGDCGNIRRAFLNGSKVETLVDEVGVRYIEGLAIDWVAGNLYWSDWDYRRIEVSRLDGSSRRTVVWKNVRPRVIAVNPVDGYIYWANWGGDRATMDRAQLDGNDASRQSMLDNVGRINAIALDFDQRRIFWSELDMPGGGQGARISVAGFNGGGRRVLVQENGVVPYSMAFFADMLFFANYPTKTIEVVNATTGANRSVLHDSMPEINNLVVAHGQKQKGWNECHENNGHCSHLCFARPRIDQGKQTIECGCPDHFDGFPKQSPMDCTPPQSFILVATDGQFARWKVAESGDALLWDADPIVVLPLKDIGAAVSIQFDPVTRFIYWIDKGADVIYRARDTDTAATPLALHKKTLCAQPHSLALDVYGRQLFVSCTGKDKKDVGAVHVWRLDAEGEENKPRQYIGCVVDPTDITGTSATPLPRAIAIFPDRNLLFYVDIKHASTIVRCTLNGRDCKKFVTKNLQTPTELHAAKGHLYYTTTDGIWSSPVADSGPSSDQHETMRPRQHLVSSARDKPMIVVGNRLLAVFGDSPQTDSVVSFDLNSRAAEYKYDGQPFLLLPKRQKVSGLLFVPPIDANSRSPLQSPCLPSPCPHLCRVVPSERVEGLYQRPQFQCLCSLGYIAGPRNVDSCFEHVSCSPWQFKCLNGQSCVHRLRVCDGESDCQDESDEANCKIGTQLFACANGRGVERENVCDGINNCGDDSDESNCRCANPVERFDCTGWMKTSDDKDECVSRKRQCDGVADCRSGADEQLDLCAKKVTGTPRTIESSSTVDPMTPTFLVAGGLVVVFVMIICCVLCYCRRKPPQSINTSTARVIVNPTDGRRDGPVQIEVFTYSGPRYSGWPGDALPPPNSEASELRQYPRSCLTGRSSSSGMPTSDEFDTGGRFYAPPPSAASMSTYGVVKPAAVKVRTDPRRRSRQKPKHHRRHGSARDFEETELLRTPPPTYSEVQGVTPCSTVVDNGSYYRNNRDMPSTPIQQQYSRGAAPPPSPVTIRSAAHQRDHRPRSSRRPLPQRPLRQHQPSTSSHSYNVDDDPRAPMNSRAVKRSSVSSGDSDQVIYENMRARDPPPSPAGGSSDS